MECANMNSDSIDYMKSNGIAFDCEDCTKKLKQKRDDCTPVKPIPIDSDVNIIVSKLDDVLKNQITTNNTLTTVTTLSNRILELEKTEKESIIQTL